jgi:hypothetical protein
MGQHLGTVYRVSLAESMEDMLRLPFEPHEPYKEEFGRAKVYLQAGAGRRYIHFIPRASVKPVAMLYARYLLECKLGRKLTALEQADHIDNDKLNDELDNLAVLSQEENHAKGAALQVLNRANLPFIHGDISSYVTFKCRCSICTVGARAYAHIKHSGPAKYLSLIHI